MALREERALDLGNWEMKYQSSCWGTQEEERGVRSEGNLVLGHVGFEVAIGHSGRDQEAVDSQVSSLSSGDGARLEQIIRSVGTQMVTKASGRDYITKGSHERRMEQVMGDRMLEGSWYGANSGGVMGAWESQEERTGTVSCA